MPNVTTTKVVLNYYDTKCVRTQPSVNCDTDVQDVYEWALPSSHRVYSSMVRVVLILKRVTQQVGGVYNYARFKINTTQTT